MRPSWALLSLSLALSLGAHGDVPPPPPARPHLAVALAAPANAARRHGFYFSRAVYADGGRRRWGGAWATDFPKADLQFLTVLRRLLPTIDVSMAEHPLSFTDPELRRYPYLYAVEVGNLVFTDEDVAALREYLLGGGFLFVDDFWGSYEWAQFESQIRRVFPDRPIVELPLDHPVFTTYYRIEKVVQVPNVNNGCSGYRTHERDGIVPAVLGILDDDGRVLVLISWNSDLGDAWEWAEQSCYPLEFSTYAFQLAVNTIVYAMSR